MELETEDIPFTGSQYRSSSDLDLLDQDLPSESMSSFQVLEPSETESQLVQPWRKTSYWDSGFLDQLKHEVETFTPPRELNVKQSRILILGPVGAGKSSFCNTVSSVFSGHVSSQACCGSSEQSITSKAKSQLVQPWRKTSYWDSGFLDQLKHEVETFTPPRELNVKQSRILILGPVGAGKSSFFNTVSTVFSGHVSSQACCGSSEQSITSKFRMYQVRSQTNGKPINFRLCDTRGLDETQGIGPLDVDYLLEGNVPDGYQFNPTSSISPDISGFKRMPTLNDKIHCVCFVLDGTSTDVLTPKMLEKIKSLQIKIHQKAVPQFILLTKVDKCCSHVESVLSDVFRSHKIKELVRSVSDFLGVPRNHVLPMKNYENETDPNDDVNILALLSLRQMLRASEDFMFNFLDQIDESTKSSDMVHVDMFKDH